MFFGFTVWRDVRTWQIFYHLDGQMIVSSIYIFIQGVFSELYQTWKK